MPTQKKIFRKKNKICVSENVILTGVKLVPYKTKITLLWENSTA